MLFSSSVFLFHFLPMVLLLHLLAGKRFRNTLLLAASLYFYAWGETLLVAIMLVSIACNYGFGLWVAHARETGGRAKLAVGVAIAFDLGLLIVFKYANWLWENLQLMFGSQAAPLLGWAHPSDLFANAIGTGEGHLRLPIGISFFTFQAMSYVIDVYRRDVAAQRNPVRFALYISLFPQLIAGPIVRYRDIAVQLAERTVSRDEFASGVRRFVLGLGKKMLIANTLAVPADAIFALQPELLPANVAWIGILCYSLQIYFDFSGYSDMAIGLGKMFGFDFLENFRHPYVARSVTEFWRRWHISLSSWFRDYLYIPLGGSRRGSARTAINLLIVFLLCGLWHGASWSFVVWGLFHGGFLVLERVGLGERLRRLPRIAQHTYVIVACMLGWVFFRAADIEQAMTFIGSLFGTRGFSFESQPLHAFLESPAWLALLAGIVGSTPWYSRLSERVENCESESRLFALTATARVGGVLLLSLVFGLSVMLLAAGTYNPFIYFRF